MSEVLGSGRQKNGIKDPNHLLSATHSEERVLAANGGAYAT